MSTESTPNSAASSGSSPPATQIGAYGERRLKGGSAELQGIVYEALAAAPEEIHGIVNAFRSHADQGGEQDAVKMFRSFVTKRRLGEAKRFRTHRENWLPQPEDRP